MRSEVGDTLVEVLIALSVIGLTAGALLGAFSTSIAATGEHHSLAEMDTVLKSFVESAIYQIQQQPSPLFTTTCPTVANPNPYSSLSITTAPYTATITAVNGTPAVQYSTGVHPTTWGSCVTAQKPPQSQLVQAQVSGNGASETTFFVVNDPSYAPANATPPTITNPTNGNDVQTAVVGGSGFNLLITTSGFPSGSNMNISLSGVTCPDGSHALPCDGMTFVDNQDGTATLSGFPSIAGSYTMTIVASNGVPNDASQSFTLNAAAPPKINGPFSKTFLTGSPGSFTVTTTGTPPVNSIANASFTNCTPSILPASVQFSYTSTATTATISGTPGTPDIGTYTLCLNASNGIGTDQEAFTLIVSAGPNQLKFTTSAVSGTASNGALIGPITIQELDSSNNPVITGLTVNLTSSSNTGIFSASSGGVPATSIVIPPGSSSVSFWYGDTTSGSPTITATPVTPGILAAPQQETIVSGPPSTFRLSNCNVDGTAGTCISAFTLKSAGHASGLVANVQVLDQFGNPAKITTPISVSVSSSNANFTVSGSPLSINGPSNQSTSTFNLKDNAHKGDTTTVTISAGGITTLAFVVTSS
jgi:Tfp pilus assembly protein PilE